MSIKGDIRTLLDCHKDLLSRAHEFVGQPKSIRGRIRNDMAIRLRFAVHGLRNNRVLHLVAVDHRKARDARPAELLGVYKHRVEETGGKKSLEWSVERIRYWLKNGAMPSPPVVRLLEMVWLDFSALNLLD